MKLVHRAEGLVVWDLFSVLPQEQAEAARVERQGPGFRSRQARVQMPAVELLVGHRASVK